MVHLLMFRSSDMMVVLLTISVCSYMRHGIQVDPDTKQTTLSVSTRSVLHDNQSYSPHQLDDTGSTASLPLSLSESSPPHLSLSSFHAPPDRSGPPQPSLLAKIGNYSNADDTKVVSPGAAHRILYTSHYGQIRGLASFVVETITVVVALAFYIAAELCKTSWVCQNILPLIFIAAQTLGFWCIDWIGEASGALSCPIGLIHSMVAFLFTGAPTNGLCALVCFSFVAQFGSNLFSGKYAAEIISNTILLTSVQVCGAVIYYRTYLLAMDLLYTEVYAFQSIRSLACLHDIHVRSIACLKVQMVQNNQREQTPNGDQAIECDSDKQVEHKLNSELPSEKTLGTSDEGVISKGSKNTRCGRGQRASLPIQRLDSRSSDSFNNDRRESRDSRNSVSEVGEVRPSPREATPAVVRGALLLYLENRDRIEKKSRIRYQRYKSNDHLVDNTNPSNSEWVDLECKSRDSSPSDEEPERIREDLPKRPRERQSSETPLESKEPVRNNDVRNTRKKRLQQATHARTTGAGSRARKESEMSDDMDFTKDRMEPRGRREPIIQQEAQHTSSRPVTREVSLSQPNEGAQGFSQQGNAAALPRPPSRRTSLKVGGKGNNDQQKNQRMSLTHAASYAGEEISDVPGTPSATGATSPTSSNANSRVSRISTSTSRKVHFDPHNGPTYEIQYDNVSGCVAGSPGGGSFINSDNFGDTPTSSEFGLWDSRSSEILRQQNSSKRLLYKQLSLDEQRLSARQKSIDARGGRFPSSRRSSSIAAFWRRPPGQLFELKPEPHTIGVPHERFLQDAEIRNETVFEKIIQHFAQMLSQQVRTEMRAYRRSGALGLPDVNAEWKAMLWSFRHTLARDEKEVIHSQPVFYGLTGWLPFQENPVRNLAVRRHAADQYREGETSDSPKPYPLAVRQNCSDPDNVAPVASSEESGSTRTLENLTQATSIASSVASLSLSRPHGSLTNMSDGGTLPNDTQVSDSKTLHVKQPAVNDAGDSRLPKKATSVEHISRTRTGNRSMSIMRSSIDGGSSQGRNDRSHNGIHRQLSSSAPTLHHNIKQDRHSLGSVEISDPYFVHSKNSLRSATQPRYPSKTAISNSQRKKEKNPQDVPPQPQRHHSSRYIPESEPSSSQPASKDSGSAYAMSSFHSEMGETAIDYLFKVKRKINACQRFVGHQFNRCWIRFVNDLKFYFGVVGEMIGLPLAVQFLSNSKFVIRLATWNSAPLMPDQKILSHSFRDDYYEAWFLDWFRDASSSLHYPLVIIQLIGTSLNLTAMGLSVFWLSQLTPPNTNPYQWGSPVHHYIFLIPLFVLLDLGLILPQLLFATPEKIHVTKLLATIVVVYRTGLSIVAMAFNLIHTSTDSTIYNQLLLNLVYSPLGIALCSTLPRVYFLTATATANVVFLVVSASFVIVNYKEIWLRMNVAFVHVFLLIYVLYLRSQDVARRRIFCMAALPYLIRMAHVATKIDGDFSHASIALPAHLFEENINNRVASENHMRLRKRCSECYEIYTESESSVAGDRYSISSTSSSSIQNDEGSFSKKDGSVAASSLAGHSSLRGGSSSTSSTPSAFTGDVAEDLPRFDQTHTTLDSPSAVPPVRKGSTDRPNLTRNKSPEKHLEGNSNVDAFNALVQRVDERFTALTRRNSRQSEIDIKADTDRDHHYQRPPRRPLHATIEFRSKQESSSFKTSDYPPDIDRINSYLLDSFSLDNLEAATLPSQLMSPFIPDTHERSDADAYFRTEYNHTLEPRHSLDECFTGSDLANLVSSSSAHVISNRILIPTHEDIPNSFLHSWCHRSSLSSTGTFSDNSEFPTEVPELRPSYQCMEFSSTKRPRIQDKVKQSSNRPIIARRKSLGKVKLLRLGKGDLEIARNEDSGSRYTSKKSWQKHGRRRRVIKCQTRSEIRPSESCIWNHDKPSDPNYVIPNDMVHAVYDSPHYCNYRNKRQKTDSSMPIKKYFSSTAFIYNATKFPLATRSCTSQPRRNSSISEKPRNLFQTDFPFNSSLSIRRQQQYYCRSVVDDLVDSVSLSLNNSTAIRSSRMVRIPIDQTTQPGHRYCPNDWQLYSNSGSRKFGLVDKINSQISRSKNDDSRHNSHQSDYTTEMLRRNSGDSDDLILLLGQLREKIYKHNSRSIKQNKLKAFFSASSSFVILESVTTGQDN